MISSLRRPFLRSARVVKRWYSVSSSCFIELEAEVFGAFVQGVAAAVFS